MTAPSTIRRAAPGHCAWRKALRATALGLTLALALAARAQTEERVWVLNADRSIDRYRRAEDAFRQAWNAPTVDIDLSRLDLDEAEVARRLAAGRPAAVYCIGSKSYLLAAQLLPDQDIVLSSAIQWQRFPPRENRWVIANEVPIASQLNLFRYVFPQVKRVGILCSRTFSASWAEEAARVGSGQGFEMVTRCVSKPGRNEGPLRELLDSVDALWLTADPVVLAGTDAVREIFAAARAARKPIFAYSSSYAAMGAALMVSPDDATIGRQAAQLLQSIVHGESPTNRLQSPAGTEVTLNLRVVKECQLELNEQALDSINHIIR